MQCETVFYADKKKVFILSATAFFGAVAAVFALVHFDTLMESQRAQGLPRGLVAGLMWFVLSVCAFVSLKISAFLSNRKAVLVVNGQGVEYCQMWRQRVAWENVADIRPYEQNTRHHTEKGVLVFLKDNEAFLAHHNFLLRLMMLVGLKAAGTPFMVNSAILRVGQETLLAVMRKGWEDYREAQRYAAQTKAGI